MRLPHLPTLCGCFPKFCTSESHIQSPYTLVQRPAASKDFGLVPHTSAFLGGLFYCITLFVPFPTPFFVGENGWGIRRTNHQSLEHIEQLGCVIVPVAGFNGILLAVDFQCNLGLVFFFHTTILPQRLCYNESVCLPAYTPLGIGDVKQKPNQDKQSQAVSSQLNCRTSTVRLLMKCYLHFKLMYNQSPMPFSLEIFLLKCVGRVWYTGCIGRYRIKCDHINN